MDDPYAPIQRILAQHRSGEITEAAAKEMLAIVYVWSGRFDNMTAVQVQQTIERQLSEVRDERLTAFMRSLEPAHGG